MSHTSLTPTRERMLLLTLAGIQFTYILDFMVMMPLGPQFTTIFRFLTPSSARWSRPTRFLPAPRGWQHPRI